MKNNRTIALLSISGLAALPASGAALYTAGHGDIGLAYEAGALDPHVHLHDGTIVDGVPINNPPDGEEYAPEDVLIFVSNPSVARPAGAQWDFIGNSAASPVWFLPQTEDPAKPWLGIASEELDPLDWTGPLTIKLTGMTGPGGGHFSLYENDAFGNPVVAFATSDGITGADSIGHTAGAHDHFNYAFTQPGIYELTFTFSGVHAVDGAQSASATYFFGVTVPEPSTALLSLGMLAGLTLRRRR